MKHRTTDRPRLAGSLFEYVRGDRAGDVSQTHLATGVAVGKLFVIETKQILDGGVPIADVHLVLDRFIFMLVGVIGLNR